MKKSSKTTKHKTSLCITLARFMSAPQEDCPRLCSQLQCQLLNTLGHEGWTEGARRMTEKQLKHHVPLYFPNQVNCRFPLRSKQPGIETPHPSMDRKLMSYPQAVHRREYRDQFVPLIRRRKAESFKNSLPMVQKPSYPISFW